MQHIYWSQLYGKQIDRKYPKSPGGQEVDHEPARGIFIRWPYSILGCMMENVVKEAIPTLCLSLRKHIWSSGSNSELSSARETALSPSEAMGMIKVQEHLTYERLRELWLFNLEKKRFRRILSRNRKSWWQIVRKMKPGTSQWQGQGKILTGSRKYYLINIRKKSGCVFLFGWFCFVLLCRWSNTWNTMLGEAVEPPWRYSNLSWTRSCTTCTSSLRFEEESWTR